MNWFAGAPDVAGVGHSQTRGAACLFNSGALSLFSAVQPLTYIEDPSLTGQHFGAQVAALPGNGDITNDGTPDFLVSKSFWGGGQPQGLGKIYVIDTRNNKIFAQARSSNPSYNFGNAITGTDVIGNRYRFAATDPHRGLIHLF